LSYINSPFLPVNKQSIYICIKACLYDSICRIVVRLC